MPASPRRRRRLLALLLVAAGSSLLALARTGAPLGPESAAPLVARADCGPLGLLCTPTPTARPTASATPTGHSTPTARPTTSPGGPTGSSSPAPTDFPPPFYPAPPPPTLPVDTSSPGPQSPPEPPQLAVQKLVLVAAATDNVPAGSPVLVEVTAEAARGTDTYAVAHVPLDFTIESAPGHGAQVTPASADSGDFGAVEVTVRTGDQPGDTVLAVSVTNGSLVERLTIHGVAGSLSSSSSTSTSAASPQQVQTGTTGGAGSGQLAAAGVLASLAGVAVLVALVKRPLPFLRRRRVWGRRSI